MGNIKKNKIKSFVEVEEEGDITWLDKSKERKGEREVR